MFTKMNMSNNNGEIGSGKKEKFEVRKDIHFISKIPFLKEFWIQFSDRPKSYMAEICQNFQKTDNQGAETKSFFKEISKFLFLNEAAHSS